MSGTWIRSGSTVNGRPARGPRGDAGPQGAPGTPGEHGQDGAPGGSDEAMAAWIDDEDSQTRASLSDLVGTEVEQVASPLAQAAVNTFAHQIAPVAFPVGRRVLVLGDSHTDGAGSSNVTFCYAEFVPRIAGTSAVRLIRRGYPGERSEQLLARLPGLIAAEQPDLISVMCGTNDDATLAAAAVFIANIAAMKQLADASRIPFVVCLVPPVASSVPDAVARQVRNVAKNQHLYRWASDAGVTLIDTRAALLDRDTGYLAAMYDSGDGIHFNNAGHLELAKAIAPVLAALGKRGPWPVVAKGHGLLPNPLGNAAGTAWVAIAGVPSGSYQDPVAGDGLTAGKWYQIAFDNSGGSSGVSAIRGQNIDMSNVDVGDQLVAFYRLKTGGSGTVAVRWLQGSTSVSIPVDGIGVAVPYSGYISTRTVTAADKASTFRLGFSVSVPAAANGSASIGQVDVFNATKGDLVGLY